MAEQRKPATSKRADALDPYCRHGNLTTSCEDCAYVRYVERGGEIAGWAEASDRAPRVAGRPAGPVAAQDLVIVRTDLQRNDSDERPLTLVRKGDPIPPNLVDLERQAPPDSMRFPPINNDPPEDAPRVRV